VGGRVAQPPRTPEVHEPSTGWLSTSAVAVSAPVSSGVPVARTQEPTLMDAALAVVVVRNVVPSA